MNDANFQAVETHYRSVWNSDPTVHHWQRGPVTQFPNGFRVLVFPPSPSRSMWTYATCGMSAAETKLELHLFSPHENDGLTEILYAVAHFHLHGAPLDLHHTVNFGKPWLPGSLCDRGFVSLPYLDGPELEWMHTGSSSVRFLWLIPVMKQEVDFKIRRGPEALENAFEEKGFNYLDPLRPSVI